MGALGWLGLAMPAALWRRRRRHDDQRRLPGSPVTFDLGRFHHHCAGAHRHGESASGPCRPPAARARGCRGIIARRVITAVAVTEPDAGSDVAAIRTRAHSFATARDLGARRQQDVHHERRARRPGVRRGAHRRQRRRGQELARHVDLRRRARHAGLSRRARTRRSRAGSRPTPPSWCSKAAACRQPTARRRERAASTRS